MQTLGDSWLIALLGFPRGARVTCETGCRSTQRLTSQLKLAPEPECLENRTAITGEDPRDGAVSVRDTHAVCGLRYWVSKPAPPSRRSRRSPQSSAPGLTAPSLASSLYSFQKLTVAGLLQMTVHE